MARWRVIDTEANDGAYNMAVDQVLAQGVAKSPVLRFYDWDPPAVSCGYGQRSEREVDSSVCSALGIDIVRRPTGGRAVLHWEELTYSVVCDPRDLNVGGGEGVEGAHRTIAECLAVGLRLFGAAVEVERARRPIERSQGPRATSPCFSSTARWELKCQGRKLVGSAQRRFRDGLLQHGSILLGPAHERLPELMRIGDDRREQWTAMLKESSIDLGECITRRVSRDELVACLIMGFEERLGLETRRDELHADEVGRTTEFAGGQSPVALQEVGA